MERFDYEKTMSNVHELRQIADDVIKTYNMNFAITSDNARDAWKGETGVLFHSKCKTLGEQVKNEVANIRMLANYLEKAAKAMRVADMESAGRIQI